MPEPSQHVAEFQQSEAINLSWNPEGENTTHYLILMNTTGCEDFTLPDDGESYGDSETKINLPASNTTYTWFVDPAVQSYYFMIIPYNSDSFDYKTDGNIPCSQVDLSK